MLSTSNKARLATMMFLQYFAAGAWLVPLGSYMSKVLHFDDVIGAAYGMIGIATIISTLFGGVIADRYFAAQKLLGVCALLSAGTLWWLSTISANSSVFLFAMLLHCTFYTCSIPLGVAVALTALPEPQTQFPGVRVFGTTGWIVAGIVIGLLPGAARSALPMSIGVFCYLILGIYAFTLPNTPPTATREKVDLMGLFGLDIVKGRRDKLFWIFIFTIAMMSIPKKFYDSFLNNFLVEKNVGLTILGMSVEATAVQTMGQLVEVATLLCLPYLLKRLGIKWVMVIGMVGWIARFVIFASSAKDGASHFTLIMIGILLHGLSYDFLFVSGQIWFDSLFDSSMRSRAQAFYWFILSGVGVVVGANIAGWVYKANTSVALVHDWNAIWMVPGVVTLAVLCAFVFLFHEQTVPIEKTNAGRGEKP